MFGYVIANAKLMSKAEKERYQACYCGLCASLARRYGPAARLLLTYDMSFLVLLFLSLEKEAGEPAQRRCPLHPLRTHASVEEAVTDYAADMNVILAYYNLLDDWQDDGDQKARLALHALQGAFEKAAAARPKQHAEVAAALQELSVLESCGETNPDLPANCFGRLMRAIFAWQEDENSAALQQFGYTLGRFIYLMDAVLDRKKDLRKERYNALLTLETLDDKMMLELLMADCVAAYRQLPVQRDQGLLENILYSGVWTRWAEAKARETRRDARKKDGRENEIKGTSDDTGSL